MMCMKNREFDFKKRVRRDVPFIEDSPAIAWATASARWSLGMPSRIG
jgi:hypothetical protein